jgi:M3 family oligoendopeptidase
MQTERHFRHYPKRPSSLTSDFVESEYALLKTDAVLAEKNERADSWEKVFHRWDEFKSYTHSELSRARYRYSGALSDPKLEAEDSFMREKINPLLEKGNSEILNALMDSKHREALTQKLGVQLFRVLETQVGPLDPRLADLRVEEDRLKSDYRKFLGTAVVDFQGEKLTLTKLQSFHSSPAPELRKNAFLTHREWFVSNRPKIAKIFDELVKIRQQMAQRIGDQNYLGLGYLGMGRTDYGVKESAEFRKLVRDFVVPLQTRIHADHAKALGTPTLRPWDGGFHPNLVLPMNIVPIDTQLDRAQKVFDRVSPKLAAHFKRMREAKLIDLENRPGKAPGAFCTSFTDEAMAAILCNSTGETRDVTTLMHEMGHAFQAIESMQDNRTIELVVPTMDAAEIHSMGMEYLSLPKLDEFFSPSDQEKVRKGRWKSAVELFTYVALVDEFQHWVYTNPSATLDARDAEWVRIAKIYQPSLDYSGIEHLHSTRWYFQPHIFGMPFYYIDYAIAETGAMQLGLLNSKDPKKAVEVYLELCRLGGNESVLGIFKSAGLNSPFSAENMKSLMAYAEAQLYENNPS